ncbi:UPF0182 family protein [Methyloprofundus sp.]|uniref:UPF0182 family protein n=1 Tax=Methyloprofundus sp. TaxID=2020875 RepID=UPI003D09C5B0
MRNWKLLPILIGLTLFAVIAYMLFYFIFIDFFVDLWWFRSLNFEGYFWLRLLYRFIFSGGVTIIFFSIFFFHFWIASRYLGLSPPDEILVSADKRQRFQTFADKFMYGSTKVYTPLSLILAIVIASPFYVQWEAALLFFFGSSSGVLDPVYGQDISFYLFSYPLYILIQQELLYTSIILFFLVTALYWLEHVFVPNQNKEYPLGAKVHLVILLGFTILFVIWGLFLDRFSLLYVDSHEPVFFGPGFVELRYELPLIWLSIISVLVLFVSVVINIFSRHHRSAMPIYFALAGLLTSLGLQNLPFIPSLIDSFIVRPNPVLTEGKFMENNIQATLDAFALENINIIDYKVNLDASKDIESWGTKNHFENIPVWDREYLIDGYRQLQGIRPYYDFHSVDEDRYFLNDHIQQVNLSARELNTDKLPTEAKNWENIHLRYTHGYGAVITPAAQDAGKPIIWYLRDLNMTSNVGFSVKIPDIYYGQEKYTYAIVPNDLDVVGMSDSPQDVNGVYQGGAGIPFSSFFRKLLFATYFGDEKIFFSTNISTASKLLIRRNIIDRVKSLTPFLHLDNDPYLVVTKDRFYWIQDAYTASDKYPAAKFASDNFLSGKQRFNYIRNSVKIVIDAYDGSVNYYIADSKDPIIQAYQVAYPGVFNKLDKMPTELRKHLRYPRELYYMQMKVYAKYHQIQPGLFYEQAEAWEFAKVNKKNVMPYYQTMDFGHCKDREEFVMLNPMTPINRSNLSMIGLAGTLDIESCIPGSYKPYITIYKFGKDIQVNGPAQVEALIDQSPEISEQFTLWDQHGSNVAKGRMVILPMGKNSILYVQPIYMISTKTKIPELTRVIVSIGNEVVMDTTLWSAFKKLKARFIKGAVDAKGTGTSIE